MPATDPDPPSTALDTSASEAALQTLEARFDGRLGVYAIDTGSGAMIRYRSDERFLMCSTHKVLTVAAILQRAHQQSGLLDRRIRYNQVQLTESGYAPVTAPHLAEGMTVSELCDAALTSSDNAANNLLLDILGGPTAITAFARSLGDPVTRLDRHEPELNRGAPGDERDTSTPAHMAADLRALVLDGAIDAGSRDQLTRWLRANTTGVKHIRAGVPAGWQVGDKTGSGSKGEVNDIAIIWPPGRSPFILAVYTVPHDPATTTGQATIAQAATIVADTLVPHS